MQKHCIANTTFLFRGLCILGKSSSEIHTLSAQWGIIVKPKSVIRKSFLSFSNDRH